MNFVGCSRATLALLFLTAMGASGCSSDGGDAGEGQEGSSGAATTSGNGSSSSSSSAGSGSTTGSESSSAAGSSDSGTSGEQSGDSSSSTGDDNGALIDARPYELVVPTSYDENEPTPLVVLLHGYGASAELQNIYFRFTPEAEEHGYLLALPDGILDASSRQFWNATDACCNFGGERVDDVAYLSALLDDVEEQYNVDPNRVYFVGHSNGGFMSHRLACDVGDRIAAIVSLAGATWADASACPAKAPVNILQVHGTDDETILYEGGSNAGIGYPSANDTVAQWAQKNGCTGALTDEGTADIESILAGEETRLQSYGECPEGGAVSLWTIDEGAHLPSFDEGWADAVWDYLEAHPKP